MQCAREVVEEFFFSATRYSTCYGDIDTRNPLQAQRSGAVTRTSGGKR